MQSLVQYRSIGRAAEAQVQQSRRRFQQGGLDLSTDVERYAASSEAPTPGQTHPLEKEKTNDDELRQEQDDSRTVSDASGTSASQSTLQAGEILARSLQGVSVRDGPIFVMTWQADDDKLNPRNWSVVKRIVVTFEVSLISVAVVIASSIDATALPQAAEEFGVSHVVESLATGLYLVGIGVGSVFAGPFSETFGRNTVYIGSLIVFMVWILGAALAPNIGAQLAFRFLAGCCGSTPIVCCGGSVADMWNSLDKTWGPPIYTSVGFGGSVLGAVIGASQYRRVTGDDRFHLEEELVGATFASRLRISMTRPFFMLTEPIIIAKTIYLSVLYIILFTFLVGWPYIFEYTYDISQGLTNIIFISMFIGMQCVGLLIHRKTARACRQAESLDGPANDQVKFSPELRLWYAMLGPAVAIPVSLFWLGWTANPSINIWSAILAAFLFGFGITGVFISTYLYLIDSYEIYSASALPFVFLVRYIAAGGMTVVGIPWYENMGVSHTLTILACISVLLVPIPYLLYFYGHNLRAKSKYAVSWE